MRVQVIKRYIMHSKKTAFIVEHDFIMAAYLADRVIVYEGTPSKEAVARCPQSLLTGDRASAAHPHMHLIPLLVYTHLVPPPCIRAACCAEGPAPAFTFAIAFVWLRLVA